MNKKTLFLILLLIIFSIKVYAVQTTTLYIEEVIGACVNVGVGTSTPTALLHVAGDLKFDGAITQGVDRITSATTLDNTYNVVFCDTDGGAFTVTLPAGSSGSHFKIINVGSSDNDVTIDPDASELIFGSATSYILLDDESITIDYDSTEGWY